MKTIDRIIISCCKTDFWLTRICVASIRYWHPSVPIGLLKDTSRGDFSTREMENLWDVSVEAVPNPPLGPYTKMEAFYLPGRQRLLLLDSDIVFLGPVLDTLGKCGADFVVNWGGIGPLTEEKKERYALEGYYHVERLRKAEPDFKVPDFFFNGGQMLITSSLLPREAFESLVQGKPPRLEIRRPDLFMCHEQGLLNFLLVKMMQEGKFSLEPRDFVLWSKHREMVDPIDLERLRKREGYPFIVHWAQIKPFHKTGLPRPDLLGFYEDFYYSRIPDGAWKRNYRLLRRAQKGLTPRMRRTFSVLKKTIDLRELLKNEQTPSKEANVYAYVR